MRYILAILLAVSLSGCGTTIPTIIPTMLNASTTVFHGADSSGRGTVFVQPIDEWQSDSLEFRAVAEHLLSQLQTAGYAPALSEDKADFIAFMTYGIDSGHTTTSAVPVRGQTGGGTSYTSGTVSTGSGTATYSGTTIEDSTYGVVGVGQQTSVMYRRELNIDIYQANAASPQKVYEIRVVSVGSCGVINAIVQPLVDAAFKDFPGESGKTRRVNVSLGHRFGC